MEQDVMVPRILFVAQPTITGVGQCVLDWTTGLASRGWDVSLACPADGWLGRKCAEAGIPVNRWDSVRQPYKGVKRELDQLRAIVHQRQPDVVYLNGSKAGLIGRLLLRGNTPTAFSPHSWSYEAADGPVGWAALQWERQAARWTTVFIAVSDAEAADGRAHGIHGRYVVARNGVDTAAVTPASGAIRAKLRADRGLDDNTVCVVCIGRVHRQKGQDILLQAWPQVSAANARLVIVGDGPDLEQARTAASADVVFAGSAERPQALQWMQAADLLVMPSRWEGMALVPMESLAVGTPVIASDVIGVREAIDASCGAVFAPEDPTALAAALDEWIPRVRTQGQALRDAARRHVVGSFELSTTLSTLDGTLRGLLH